MTRTVDITEPGAIEAALFNPFDQEVRADPWPLCRELRRHDPVYESPFGIYLLTGYEDAVNVLRDHRFGVDPKKATGLSELTPTQSLGFAQRGLDDLMLFVDPPDHSRLRSLVNKAFTPRRVEAAKPRIRAIVNELIDAVESRGQMNVIDDLAYPLPVTVIAEMLGIPEEDRPRFRQWSWDLAPILDPFIPGESLTRLAEAGLALVSYFDDLIADRRAHPGDDLISSLIRAEEEGDKLTRDELRATCILLLVAGHETTMNLIGNGTLALLRNPDQLSLLRAEPEIARSAIEELLRHDGPAMLTARIALEDVEVRDKTIPEGHLAVVIVGAVNRDPDEFPDPDRLLITRTPNRHIAFSAGSHFCLGATLARAEAQIAVEALVTRLPSLALADTDPRWRATITFRGLEALPVTF